MMRKTATDPKITAATITAEAAGASHPRHPGAPVLWPPP
jgi:hypothetical protein